MVYKLVEVDGRPVAKRSENKASRGGRKTAVRRHKASGTATEEIVVAQGTPESHEHDRALQIPLARGGVRAPGLPSLDESREHLRQALISVPWEGLKLSHGDPAIPVTFPEATR
jgi:nicotinate phosphoribosyltransferase